MPFDFPHEFQPDRCLLLYNLLFRQSWAIRQCFRTCVIPLKSRVGERECSLLVPSIVRVANNLACPASSYQFVGFILFFILAAAVQDRRADSFQLFAFRLLAGWRMGSKNLLLQFEELFGELRPFSPNAQRYFCLLPMFLASSCC